MMSEKEVREMKEYLKNINRQLDAKMQGPMNAVDEVLGKVLEGPTRYSLKELGKILKNIKFIEWKKSEIVGFFLWIGENPELAKKILEAKQ